MSLVLVFLNRFYAQIFLGMRVGKTRHSKECYPHKFDFLFLFYFNAWGFSCFINTEFLFVSDAQCNVQLSVRNGDFELILNFNCPLRKSKRFQRSPKTINKSIINVELIWACAPFATHSFSWISHKHNSHRNTSDWLAGTMFARISGLDLPPNLRVSAKFFLKYIHDYKR